MNLVETNAMLSNKGIEIVIIIKSLMSFQAKTIAYFISGTVRALKLKTDYLLRQFKHQFNDEFKKLEE